MPGKTIVVKVLDETEGNKNSGGLTSESLTVQEARERVSPSTPLGAEGKAKAKGIAVASMIAHRSFSYVTSNVGKWTGSNQNQQKVNNVRQLASLGILTYINPYVGIASIALSMATTSLDEAYDRRWSQKTAANAQARAGYSSTNEVVGRRH
ncbi:MAG: hypothetical protein NC310_00290 [Roseburia sp.]|nr:hypothetical protein [Anaeroplasma bactoclasticum]MCM1195491.1 hypothetical protein [Roseburia sp.]MCM1556869.1 hypothetical protein [Anaeroplasma bactoclasticum]